MKKLALFALGVLCTSTLLAQDPEIEISKDFSYTVSDPYSVVDGSKHYFEKDGEIVTLKYGKGKFHIQKFSEDKLNEVERNMIPKDEGFTPEHYMEFNGRYYFFFSRWDRAAAKEQLFVREVDFDNAVFVNKGERIIAIDGKVTGGWFGGKFHFTKSFSEDRLMIQYRKAPKEKRDALNKDVIGMHVYDGNLEELWSNQVEMPYTEKKMDNLAYTIDSKSNGYLLAQVRSGDGGRGSDSHLELIRIDSDDQSVTANPFDVGDLYINDLGFFEGNKGEIIVAGYYGNTDGAFMAKLSDEGDLEEFTKYEIPVEIMSKYMSQRKQDKMKAKDDKKDLAMANMVLREVSFNDDGSVTLYGERYYTVTTYTSNGQQKTTYYYEDILVTHINADGSLGWMDKLPKRQRGGRGRGGMGYYLMAGKEYDYVLFLDNVRNIALTMDQYPKFHQDGRGGFLTGFKINKAEGKVEKVSILDTRDAKGVELFQFATSRIIRLSDDSFGVECYKKGKEDVMLKVTLEN